MAISRFSARFCVILSAFSAVLHAADRRPVDWAKAGAEVVEHLAALVKLDTSNPPRNETRAAGYVQQVLAREGIPARMFALEPGRANLVARLKGDGSRRPILVMGHTDVVGVQRSKWTVDPFGAVLRGGFLWGRGAQDDKDHVAAGLMLMLLLKRLEVPLARDVIFLAEASEESGGADGIRYMVEQHWPEIEAEYALAEGGTTVAAGGKVRYVSITTTEKVPRGMRLVAHGTAGHGSRPTPDNAVVHLAAAVAKMGAWQPPMRLSETTRVYFERLASVSPPEQAARYRRILDPAHATETDRYFRRHELGHYSILRTSITPTMVTAGFRVNVIPSEAEAYLDVRALPDENMDRLVAALKQVIADPAVEVIPPAGGGRPATPPSRIDTPMFRALEHAQQRLFPGAVTLPAMLTGATDMAQLRARGVQAYGFGPVTEQNDGLGGAHSDDERIAVASLQKLLQFLWDTVIEMAAK